VPVTEQQENELKALVNKLVVDGLGGEIIKQGLGSVGGVAHEVGTLRMERTKGNYVNQHGPQPGVLNEKSSFLRASAALRVRSFGVSDFSRGKSYAYFGGISDSAGRSPARKTDLAKLSLRGHSGDDVPSSVGFVAAMPRPQALRASVTGGSSSPKAV